MKSTNSFILYIQVWDQVPWQTSFEYSEKHVAIPITKGSSNPLELKYTGI